MKKTLSIVPPEERAEAPRLQKKGRGWNIAESRLDTLHETAREMRRSPTEAQARLAEALIRAELGKYRFKRYAVIGSAIVDFACQPLRVVVQIDDPAKGDPVLDRRRDRSLEAVGLTVLRYPAADVLSDADAVAATIFAEMKKAYDERRSRPRSSPSAGRPQGGRGGYQR
jgi:very-short-patch-repair endonuclease